MAPKEAAKIEIPQNESGLPLEEFEPNIRPADDLFRHVHSRWLDRTKIPADRARYGSFVQLVEQAEIEVQQIITEAGEAGSSEAMQKIATLYASFMDTDRANAAGIEPIRDLLDRVDAISNVTEFLTTLGSLEREGVGGFLQAYVDNDPGNPERYIIGLEQAGIGLPDESYYREDSFAELRDTYREYLATMFGHLGSDDAQTDADQVFELERELAAHHWNSVDSRDSKLTYNLRRLHDDLHALKPWALSLASEKAFEEVVVRQPSFIAELLELLNEERLADWKLWLRVTVLRSFAPYLSEQISRDNFDFVGTALTGATKQRDRWRRGIALVEGVLGDIVGREYVARAFDESSKAKMDKLVEWLVEAYRQSITKLDWMSEGTRANAIQKLEKFTPKVGYPVKWRSYEALEISDDLVGNVRASNVFEHNREINKIGAPIDRDEWFMSPQTVNAYYNPGFNEIVFPAAILQYPFFDSNRDAAANFGAIGAVIGHEIGHGFDDQGSRYNGDGLLEDWWTDEDRARFEERTSSLIAQFDALAPSEAPDHKVNGALTIGENIGDLGGLGIAWKAYLLSLEGEEPPVVDGLTGAQRFFYAWAQAWQLKIRPEEAIRLVSIDPHSPNEHRTNQIVRNLDEFYVAFDVQEDDGLYLAPEARVTIW
ncbi:M13 family metallopeptidase [Humidisolicoccus flavus]|uniref:M13 family metallopeptidase n=1 Tax=Humidisolicoccus flavus TaxID=3111414 RepID=UPI0032549283